ncbi:MAG: phosphodiester glycosidase family protein [Defluviitaleaceae bacterium]|nr:phosphodiester glycosidase family protein [Defluviitaleaceae bacterium]
MKKIIIFTIFIAALLAAPTITLNAMQTLHEERTAEYISRGVVYEHWRRMTELGLLDVFILRVPAREPNITIAAAASEEPGLKETASTLLSATGAVAGINGDFFGLAGTHSATLGLQVDTRGVVSVSHNGNAGPQRFSSFMLAADGNFFMDFVNAHVAVYSNGVSRLPIGSYNKVSNLDWPSVITFDFMADTSAIDARIENAVKIVVRGGVITYISRPGETVDVPRDGFIVLLSLQHATQYMRYFAVGQPAFYRLSANVDIFNLQTAISGAGRLLISGEVVTAGQYIIHGVHPRSAVGMSADGGEIILMVVDGRGDSIGVSHTHMAQLMREAGAFNAMHLDGGGSSTLHITHPGDNGLTLANNPAGGFERRIINALGVYITAEAGNLHTLVIDVQETVARNVWNGFTIYGLDSYLRRIEIPQNQVAISISGNAEIRGNSFIIRGHGSHTITASFGGISTEQVLFSTNIYEIRPNYGNIRTYQGSRTGLSFIGVGENGSLFSIDPDALSISVHPPYLGSVANGVFTAGELGMGWLRISPAHGNPVAAYIPLSVTIGVRHINDLAGNVGISVSTTPGNVWAAALYTDFAGIMAPVATLMYGFPQANHTQAAYANFESLFSYNAIGFRLSVYGDMSGKWLRGQVRDAEGVVHLVTFARVIDWEGWRDTEAWLPEGVAYPVRLESIYVVSTSTDRDFYGQIWFRNLRGLYDESDRFVAPYVPQGDLFGDPLHKWLHPRERGQGVDAVFMPSTLPNGAIHNAYANSARSNLIYNANAAFYMARLNAREHNDMIWLADVHDTQLNGFGDFNVFSFWDLFIVQLAARDGERTGFQFADITQWAYIQNYLDGSFTRNIVIKTDAPPMEFTNQSEFELFHGILSRYASYGYNIFVVSTCPYRTEPNLRVMDGIRYITLGEMVVNGEINQNFYALRFRMLDGQIHFGFERIFE